MLADLNNMIKNTMVLLRKTLGILLTFTALFTCGIAQINHAADNATPAYNSTVRSNYSADLMTSRPPSSGIEKSDFEIKDGRVYPGGFPFGVKMYTDGLLIIGFADINCTVGSVAPAKDAGMQVNDIIIEANEKSISSAEEFIKIIEDSMGDTVTLVYLRDEKKHECVITPSKSADDGKYKTGMWLRDSTAGIGTVTFVIPESGVFGGLGHGICDSETGALIPLSRGITSDVTINGIKKGRSGAPGELQGSFNGEKTGTLFDNTENGVFGIFTDTGTSGENKIKLGTKDDIKCGEAYILCTLDDNKIGKYAIEISEIHKESTGNKNFIVTVTDKKLIEKTGGIVQGMSGSPIIQNDTLVGAVTHVLVNDPTKGYGIFIDNMLKCAQSVAIEDFKKAA